MGVLMSISPPRTTSGGSHARSLCRTEEGVVRRAEDNVRVALGILRRGADVLVHRAQEGE